MIADAQRALLVVALLAFTAWLLAGLAARRRWRFLVPGLLCAAPAPRDWRLGRDPSTYAELFCSRPDGSARSMNSRLRALSAGLPDRQRWSTRTQLAAAIFEWIRPGPPSATTRSGTSFRSSPKRFPTPATSP